MKNPIPASKDPRWTAQSDYSISPKASSHCTGCGKDRWDGKGFAECGKECRSIMAPHGIIDHLCPICVTKPHSEHLKALEEPTKPWWGNKWEN